MHHPTWGSQLEPAAGAVAERPSVARGTVWLVELPDIEPHPGVIVSRTDDNARRRKVIVAVVTSRYPPRRTSEVGLGEGNGLDHPSIVHADELHSVRLGRLIEQRGALDTEQLAAVDAALRFVLDLDVT